LSSLTLCFPIGFHFLAYPNLFGIKGFVVVVVVLFLYLGLKALLLLGQYAWNETEVAEKKAFQNSSAGL
jgi:hypothetical protein